AAGARGAAPPGSSHHPPRPAPPRPPVCPPSPPPPPLPPAGVARSPHRRGQVQRLVRPLRSGSPSISPCLSMTSKLPGRPRVVPAWAGLFQARGQRNGSRYVSRIRHTTPTVTAAQSIMYRPGEQGSPVRSTRYVANRGAVPPKRAVAVLKASDRAVYRVRVVNSSTTRAYRGLASAASSPAKVHWAARQRTKSPRDNNQKSG